MEELRPGLWTWAGDHPSWTPEQGGPEGWGREVRSYALDAGAELVLIDPLVDAPAVTELARGRPVTVILTCYWHGRSASELAVEPGAVVRAPATEADVPFDVEAYAAGDDLPGGVAAFAGAYPDECTLWIARHGALVTGDAFLGGERGFRLQPESWHAEGLTRDGLRTRLSPLLELPVELLLPTHGDPVGVDAAAVLRAAVAA